MQQPKYFLRETHRERRLTLTADEVEQLSASITRRLVNYLPWENIQRLHSFLSIERLNEVNTAPLLQYVWHTQPTIKTYTSIIRGEQLMSVEIDAETLYAPSQFGIPAPQSKSRARPKLDAIIVPVLAFDASCHRLGYGLGFYDRFLNEHPSALKVGLCFDFGLVKDGIQAEAHDVQLDAIVTEKKIYLPERADADVL